MTNSYLRCTKHTLIYRFGYPKNSPVNLTKKLTFL